MTRNHSTAERLHQAMHRLPGFPDHARAEELKTNRSGRTRGARWNTTVNAAGRAGAQRWNTTANAAAAVRTARWNSNATAVRRHAKPPHVFVGLQQYIARRVGHGE
ncbi:hypothetical protein [Nocardia anaemiae]|uniref:hypothetical protein n=1 Tax=Nocardia anaemiae TaxID=263910 RepID=UPI0007A4E89A|nr:hypothetical protein [Nocardia anaemiae]